MPLNHPTRKLSTPMRMMAAILCSAPMNCTGTIMKNIETAVRNRPSGRKARALLRSETDTMMNLEKP